VRKKTTDHLQQDRAIQTRKHLMDAARRILARDGFEVARLQDIAAEAGKTRGAFYAHFADKEDLFFALFEEYIARDQERYSQMKSDAPLEKRIAKLVDQLESILRDRDRVLLFLEFKMYAIRHPHKTRRLAHLHADMCVRGSSHKLTTFPELLIQHPGKRRKAFWIFSATFDGLAMQLYFDPEGTNKTELRRKLEQLIRDQIEIVKQINAT